MNIGQMSVKAKLYGTFAILTVVIVAVSGISLTALNDANDRFTGFVAGINARAMQAQQVRTAVDRRAIAARNMAIVTKPDDFKLEKEAEAQAQQDVTARLAQLNDMMANAKDATPQGRAMIQEIGRIEALYAPVAQGIVDLAVAGKHDEAIAKINDECRPLLAALVKATDDYVTVARTRENDLAQQAAANFGFHRAVLICMCVFSIALSLVTGLLITRGLLRSLGAEPDALNGVARRVAEGDLSQVHGAASAPEGSVLASMGQMQRSLVELISRVHTAADSIATGASQIASGNIDLSSRTEQQASSLQETASSMEQLTSTVKQNAENSQQASTLSSNASEVAEKGNQVVGRVVTTMGEISASSTRIAEITGIIEGIAFQTNILALNAAVEAARAGEQGRGFAVVASEVRNLAQRSSSAAKEIKDLIAESVQMIQDGSSFATEAGRTMSEVTHAVARVTDIMGEIAAASHEQSRGIEQVNQAITQMDAVTQQNAALVEEAAAASKSLEGQGQQLNHAVAFFRLDGSQVSEVRALGAFGAAVEPAKSPRAALPATKSAPVAKRTAVARVGAAAPRRITAAVSAPVAAGAGSQDGWDTF